eukprot:4276212-Pyramimonas_sp.AAC.1
MEDAFNPPDDAEQPAARLGLGPPRQREEAHFFDALIRTALAAIRSSSETPARRHQGTATA